MVGYQQRFAKNRLPIAVGDPRVEVRARTVYQCNHLAQIAAKVRQALLPSRFVRRCFRFWPVAVWKCRRDVLGTSAEFQDVPLRDAQVLEKLPGRMRQPRGSRSAQRRREILQRIVKMEVRATTLEQMNDVFAEQFAFVSRGFGAWTRRSFLHGAVSDTNTVLGGTWLHTPETCRRRQRP